MSDSKAKPNPSDSDDAFINRDVSWLGFSSRVVAMAANPELPLLERIRFVGITGMLHDEFFMKRMSGLKRQITKGSKSASMGGLRPTDAYAVCIEELLRQEKAIASLIAELLPQLGEYGWPIRDHHELTTPHRKFVRSYFKKSVLPILTPLAVDAAHPFPFISNLGLNIAVQFPPDKRGDDRFVRIKVPGNRPRWVPLPDNAGVVPLEQVIAANLEMLFPGTPPKRVDFFRVTRGTESKRQGSDDDDDQGPGSIVHQVTNELKARRFAGVVRLQVDERMPKKLVRWLASQLKVEKDDIYPTSHLLVTRDLASIEVPNGDTLRYPEYEPVTAPRLRRLEQRDPAAIFEEIARGDILVHHPYESFDSSVLRFLESAARDPKVLGIKLTIYRTNSDSPIVQALAEAARRGKQVAVVVEITATFDEAPNILWGQLLEREGVHVTYGVERLKAHVKLALVVREEAHGVKRYLHAGTGNYHTGTARIYEDLGVLTCNQDICAEATSVFNSLTGGAPYGEFRWLLVAPQNMRERFLKRIKREAEHAAAGKPSRIRAKMNQLQDPEIIQALYKASGAGVPITLNVRGLCCLRPGVPGLSETIRVASVVGRFLEHSRIYEFENAGEPEIFIGSADWMKRNLSSRVETMLPVLDSEVRARLSLILDNYDDDNASAWDCGPDGAYVQRSPEPGEPRREVQQILIEHALGKPDRPRGKLRSVP